jgi:hypothetical protein
MLKARRRMPGYGVLRSIIAMLFLTILAAVATSSRVTAGGGQTTGEQTSGRELYEAACAACHGPDGRGADPNLLGFDTQIPDFTDCSFSTVEPDADWMAVSHDGGPARAFDRRMPAYGQAMTEAEPQRTLDYIRRFCAHTAWPRGELNLPRPLFTEKAFPENEAVLSTVGVSGEQHVGNELVYEQRLGPSSQFEVAPPLVMQEGPDDRWHGGLGDVAVGVKHAEVIARTSVLAP